MATINDAVSGNAAKVDALGSQQTGLYDLAGNPIAKTVGGTYVSTDRFLPVAGLNDSVFRPARVDRTGGQAIAKQTPWGQLSYETGAMPSNYTQPATTMTGTHAVVSGAFLNANSTVAINTHISLISMTPIPKMMRAPILSRKRARISQKGGANAAADIHALSSTPTPGSAVLPFGFSFLYTTDGMIRPVMYINSAAVVVGTDIASLILTDRYYKWDIILDDDSVRFIVQDPSTAAKTIITDQTIDIAQLDSRIGQVTHWYSLSRVYVGGTAGTGAATQLYVSDEQNSILDLDAARDWGSYQASNLCHALLSPVAALSQLANYANSAAPASATLSNTAAGYTTLGGQFQFAAVAGAETDYALFGFQVPSPYALVVRGVSIDTTNTGAAVAVTDTALQWGYSANAPAVTLATGTLRGLLGNQGFAIGAAIGAVATPIREKFAAPITVLPGRFFHIILKMPRGTATASQIIRGTVMVDGYFE